MNSRHPSAESWAVTSYVSRSISGPLTLVTLAIGVKTSGSAMSDRSKAIPKASIPATRWPPSVSGCSGHADPVLSEYVPHVRVRVLQDLVLLVFDGHVSPASDRERLSVQHSIHSGEDVRCLTV